MEAPCCFYPSKKSYLKGRTVIISGGSRGIGRAVAVKVAKDGANVVILAKTAEAHPKLPGTIYTVAKEVEEAGGQALPILCDIRKDSDIEGAIKMTVERFGGIDVVINNASAIHLIKSMDLDMKHFDLMHQINVRGTFAVSKAALPYLLKSPNPHILNMSPPLDYQGKWFGGHTAYSMSKFGMSMVAMGMAQEYEAEGLACNTLWPETMISTAALQAFSHGEMLESLRANSRTPSIVADAAYAIVCQPSRVFSGVAAIDSVILRKQGIIDLKRYLSHPEAIPLPDFFVDESTNKKFPIPPMTQVLNPNSKL